jgi:transcriptional regulator with GAF, ATPase, and Fis domain
LLEGETGVGKELFATAIHQKSLRKNKPFIKVNCAANPVQLLESELFGFERGAFTGADRLKRGLFELANEGTLFLDEIGELPVSLQPKLLRALQEGEIQRLGSEKTIKVNVRIVAATNLNLEKEVEAGRFRTDLFYRINVFPITVPPLRQRKEDIPLLVKEFTELFNVKYNKSIKQIPGSLMDEFVNYQWPGNIRQLRNVIERAVVTSSEVVLRLADPLPQLTNGHSKSELISSSGKLSTLEECERLHILNVLEKCQWQISGEQGAAEILDLPASTLRSKMKKLGIYRNGTKDLARN